MHRWVRHLVGIVVTLIAAQVTLAGALLAQERTDGLDDRAPRFLATLSPRPVLVDVAKTPVLQRRVALDLRGTTLAQALQAIGDSSGLRIAYSRAEVPADRAIRLRAEDITVAAALTEVLLGLNVDVVFSPRGQAMLVRRTAGSGAPPVGMIVGRVTDAKTQTALAGATVVVLGTSHSTTTGSDGRYRIAEVAPGAYTVRARYIGYAPGSAQVTVGQNQEATADFTLEKSAQRLDEVVTTGTIVPTEVRALPSPISIITAEDIKQQNLQGVEQIFRGQMPGAVAWSVNPGDDFNTVVNVRGATTSDGDGKIKTFIDGVEVANLANLTTIDPSTIERIEVTRGPQASTLYGADALGGVMQIFTKHGTLGQGPTVSAKLSAGGIGHSAIGSGTSVLSDNSLDLTGGDATSSYSLGGRYRRTGEWSPGYGRTDWDISAGLNTHHGPLALSASAHYSDAAFGIPIFVGLASLPLFSKVSNDQERARQQTFGVTASYDATPTWQHTLVLGYNQSSQDIHQTQPAFLTPADSLLFAFAYQGARTSLLYHTDVRVHLGSVSAVVTGGANHYFHNASNLGTANATSVVGNLDGQVSAGRFQWANTGLFAQTELSFANQLSLTTGLRMEHNTGFGSGTSWSYSPRVGLAYVASLGSMAMKLRGAYGESIRPPSSPLLAGGFRTATEIQLANPSLGPERQHGYDTGLDLYVGQAASIGVTYFNQKVVDLIDGVLIQPSDTLPVYQNQNIGRISNTGWEFEGHLGIGALQLSGSYTITNSTIGQLSPTYTGDYLIGDRVLGIPHHVAGLLANVTPRRGTNLSLSLTHIADWVQRDFVALFGSFFPGGEPYRGSNRAYWMPYPSVTKVGVGVRQDLGSAASVFVRVENVGNTVRFENNNLTTPIPRSMVVGANFTIK